MGQTFRAGSARAFWGAVVAAFLIGPLQAQDWTGWYGGVQIGGYDARLSETETFTSTGQTSTRYEYADEGLSFGAYTGYNWQSDKLLYGAEVTLHSGEEVLLFFNPINRYTYKTRGTLDITGRLGYLVQPDLALFADAGFSMGNFDYDWIVAGVTNGGRVSSKGYTVGVSMEKLVGEKGVLRFGLRYHNRETDQFNVPALPGFSYDGGYEAVTVSVGYSIFLDR